MNTFQIIYLMALAGVFATCKPRFAAWVVLANAAATLAVCGAMDLGLTDGGLLWFLLIDSATAAALFTRRGFHVVLGAAFVVSALIHVLNLWGGIPRDTTFAIVYALNVAQIGVLWGGSVGGGGLRRGGRFVPSFRRAKALVGNQGMVAACVSEVGIGDGRR